MRCHPGGDLSAVGEAEFAEDVFHVTFGGTAGDHQTVGDLLVGEALGDERGHLGLAAGETGRRPGAPVGRLTLPQRVRDDPRAAGCLPATVRPLVRPPPEALARPGLGVLAYGVEGSGADAVGAAEQDGGALKAVVAPVPVLALVLVLVLVL